MPVDGVTVVVPVHNGAHLIRHCLASVPVGAEIIAVDDCSTDDAPQIIEAEFPAVTLIRNERNLGFGSTCNVGIQRATGDVVVLLNTDARLGAGALERLVAAFDDDKVGIAGPRLVFADGSAQTSAGWFPTPRRIFMGSFLANDVLARLRPGRAADWSIGLAKRDHEQDRDVDWVQGACLAIHRRCLADVGGFDEAYYMYVEETDLCWRAREHGWRARYVAAAVVEHDGGGSTGHPETQARRLLDSEARFISRSLGPAALGRWAAARRFGAALKILLLALPAVASGRLRGRLRWQWAALRHTTAARARAAPPG